jgi:hypothetical protein
MALPEIIFELPASQYAIMEYPGLRQGQPLDVILDAGVLLPDIGSTSWYYVQPQPLTAHLHNVSRGLAAFAGQIKAAEILKEDDQTLAVLSVDCGVTSIRVTCAPQQDGLLPFGVWETRYLAGCAPLQGIVEEEFVTQIGQCVGVTIWQFHRLVLTPGDPLFGKWFASDALPPAPYQYDRVFITTRLHQRAIYTDALH